MRAIAYRIGPDSQTLVCSDCFKQTGASEDGEDVYPIYDHTEDVDSFDCCDICRTAIRDDWYARRNRKGKELIAVYTARLARLLSRTGGEDGGDLPSYAWPGGYDLIYASKYSSDWICSDCANLAVKEFKQAAQQAGEDGDYTNIESIGDDLPAQYASLEGQSDLWYCDNCGQILISGEDDQDQPSYTEQDLIAAQQAPSYTDQELDDFRLAVAELLAGKRIFGAGRPAEQDGGEVGEDGAIIAA